MGGPGNHFAASSRPWNKDLREAGEGGADPASQKMLKGLKKTTSGDENPNMKNFIFLVYFTRYHLGSAQK